MASFGGLISSVMGRTAEGYGKAADMEMKKQGELDLRKQLLEAETEKQLRIDEIKRGRDVSDRLTEEARVQTPAYLEATAKAEAEEKLWLLLTPKPGTLSLNKTRLWKVRKQRPPRQPKLQKQKRCQRATTISKARANCRKPLKRVTLR